MQPDFILNRGLVYWGDSYLHNRAQDDLRDWERQRERKLILRCTAGEPRRGREAFLEFFIKNTILNK
jgi:hypothetical protein